jgi:hypothetical protein
VGSHRVDARCINEAGRGAAESGTSCSGCTRSSTWRSSNTATNEAEEIRAAASAELKGFRAPNVTTEAQAQARLDMLDDVTEVICEGKPERLARLFDQLGIVLRTKKQKRPSMRRPLRVCLTSVSEERLALYPYASVWSDQARPVVPERAGLGTGSWDN